MPISLSFNIKAELNPAIQAKETAILAPVLSAVVMVLHIDQL